MAVDVSARFALTVWVALRVEMLALLPHIEDALEEGQQRRQETFGLYQGTGEAHLQSIILHSIEMWMVTNHSHLLIVHCGIHLISTHQHRQRIQCSTADAAFPINIDDFAYPTLQVPVALPIPHIEHQQQTIHLTIEHGSTARVFPMASHIEQLHKERRR